MQTGLPARGRGARSNASGRYEARTVEAFDDGWDEADAPAPRLATTLTAERARSVISRNTSPDVPFDQAINTYRGCEHGCIYCYARPNHAYVGLSPGIDFESKLFFKPDAPRLLEQELARPGYVCRPIHIGGVTDVYQPVERPQRLTRACMEVLQACGHPFSVITKSALIARDADILGDMGARGLVRAFVSVTTLDRRLARDMEPRAATPERRLQAIRTLAEAGVPVGVGFSPVIPGLNDHEMEAVLERARDAGASTASFILLRLPREIAGLFKEWLAEARPDRAERVMSLIRQARGGRENDPRFGDRMKGAGPVAALIASRFRLACRRLGLNTERRPLRTDLFRPPRAAGQMDLFG
ncbi:MAG: PA0069 family radical SAM protein [Caulobacteraceae bacterium]|nr:PA0069 family radical SAM protein [Caulobacter sp.]